MSPPSVCPVCGVWSKGGALPSDSLCQGHYVLWCMSPECNTYHANLDGRAQAWNAWLTRVTLQAPAALREEGVRGIHPPEGGGKACPRCGGRREDPEYGGPCGECSPGSSPLCLARMGYNYTCRKPQGHDGPHHDTSTGTHWSR